MKKHAIAYLVAGLAVLGSFLAAKEATSMQPIREQAYMIAAAEFQCDSVCVSPVMRPSFVFAYLAFEWPAELDMHYRYQERGMWTEWIQARGEADHRDGDGGNNVMLVPTGDASAFQFRSGKAGVVTATVFRFPTLAVERDMRDFEAAANSSAEDFAVMSRAQWLDLSIELASARRDELWPAEYEEIKKIIIHHTATEIRDINKDGVMNAADYRELVRALYHYHAATKGWGDVGYQYIIDPLGTIYEGRTGGDGIVGGHAIRGRACTKFGTSRDTSFNNGTIGIALLGTYSNQEATPEAKEALTSLIAKKSWEFGFEPAGSGFFQDRIYGNVIGHRDVDCTDCPGNGVHASLFEISAVAQQKFENYSEAHPKEFRAEIVPEDAAQSVQIPKGGSAELTLRFRNTGTATWRGYGGMQTVLANANIKEHLAALDGVKIAATSASSTPASFVLSRMSPMNVGTGEVGTFKLRVKDVPSELLSEQAVVLALGDRGWFQAADARVQIENTGLEEAATVIEEDAEKEWNLSFGEKTRVTLHFTNRGTKEWKRGDVKLFFDDETSESIRDVSWKQKTGGFDFSEEAVLPGETAAFAFDVKPKKRGELRGDVTLGFGERRVSGSDYTSLWMSADYRYAAEIAYQQFPGQLLKTDTGFASLSVRNGGLEAWSKPQLVIVGKDGKAASAFRAASWKGSSAAQEGIVESGEVSNFVFDLKAPTKAGTYSGIFMIKDGKTTVPLMAAGKLKNGSAFSIVVKDPPKKPAVKKTAQAKTMKKK